MDCINEQTIEQALNVAVTHHQASRLAEAANIYQQVLAIDRDNADAYHLLGVVNYQEGRLELAAKLIGKACELKPKEPDFNINLGKALLGMGRLVEGAEAFWAGGDFSAAESACRQAIVSAPDDPGPRVILSRILADIGQPREAEDALYKAVACLPDDDASTTGGTGHIEDPGFEAVMKPNGGGGEVVLYQQTQAFTYLIDVVGTCNLRCPSCAVGNLPKSDRPKGFMEVGLFEEIIKKISTENPDKSPNLWLFNWGEPLLHPELPKIIRIAKDHDLPVMLSSNLNTKLDFKEVIRAAPETIKISLSGFSQEVYGRTHKRGRIETVKENMRKIREYMDAFGVTINVWVGYHIYRHNVAEMEPMCAYAESLGFEFRPVVASYFPLENWVKIMEKKIPADQKDLLDLMIDHPLNKYINYREYKNPELDCELRTDMMTINHDGTVALCCGVYDPENMLGVKFTDLSHQELQALKYEHDFCRTCYTHSLQSQGVPEAFARKTSLICNAKMQNILRTSPNQAGEET